MIFDKEGTTTIIDQEKKSLSVFLKNLDERYSEVKNDNIIINLFTFDKLTSGDVLEFLDISNTHRNSGRSFVIVTDKVSYNEVPDEIIVAPTLQEAKDIIEMEEIERDLEL